MQPASQRGTNQALGHCARFSAQDSVGQLCLMVSPRDAIGITAPSVGLGEGYGPAGYRFFSLPE